MVIYEDNHLLALNKPAGLLVQGDKTGDKTLIDAGKAYLREKYNKPGAVFLHPVHRIDRPVSGAVLMARTDKALGRLTQMFRDKKVVKSYLALVLDAPENQSGMLRHFLLKDEQKNTVSVYNSPYRDAKESITTYRVIGQYDRFTLLSVQPVTGRSHQIRAQLSAIGCAIAGDVKYGAPEPLPDASIALHSYTIELQHPVRQTPLVITALPAGPVWSSLDFP
ncbi:MAG: RluA family pseudouridine synthase [Bacteroidota bacterium]